MNFYLPWKVTQKRISLKMECHLKWDTTQIECNLKWDVTKNGMPNIMEHHSNWNVTQNGMSLKMDCP